MQSKCNILEGKNPALSTLSRAKAKRPVSSVSFDLEQVFAGWDHLSTSMYKVMFKKFINERKALRRNLHLFSRLWFFNRLWADIFLSMLRRDVSNPVVSCWFWKIAEETFENSAKTRVFLPVKVSPFKVGSEKMINIFPVFHVF